MTRRTIPTAPGELTPEWLTGALRETGAITNAAVRSCQAEALGEGVGFVAQLARLTVEYDDVEPGAPLSLIAKLPAAGPEGRELARLFRLYEREVRFYKDLAHKVQLRAPRCYYSDIDTETNEFVLLLEDLSPAAVGDQLTGCSAAQLDLALDELAKFHAGWWEQPGLRELDWMPLLNDSTIVGTILQSYQDIWPQFVERYGSRLPPARHRIAERFGKHAATIVEQLSAPQLTITHGDYRLDNMFFGSAAGQTPLSVIDWQVSARGRGAFDVGYFLTGTLEPEERRVRERDLLRRYHTILAKNGVQGYDFEDCWRDYRLSTLYCLAYAVIAGSVDLANERGLALGHAIVERDFAAVEDLDAVDLLPG